VVARADLSAPRRPILVASAGGPEMAPGTGAGEGREIRAPAWAEKMASAIWGNVAKTVGKIAGVVMWGGMLSVRHRLSAAAGFLAATPPSQLAGGILVLMVVAALSTQASRRSLYFWTQAFPIYVHYKVLDHQLRRKPREYRQKRFNMLHDRYAPQMYTVIITMGGFFLKLGQIGGTRQDFVPRQFTELLQTLEDQVPAEKDKP